MTDRPASRTVTDLSRRRADEDAAALVAVLAVLTAPADDTAEHRPPTVWADPAHRLRVGRPGGSAWWASGLPG
jgi:hypothetical protein